MKIRNKKTGQIIDIDPADAQNYGIELPEAAKGGMIKRADGSYSRRGLWDNIRANRGSGKKPTKEMLKQEKKIRAAEKAYGGYMQMGGITDTEMAYGGYMSQGGINNPGFMALPEYVQEKIKANMAVGGCMECGGKMQAGGKTFADIERERANILKQMNTPVGASEIIDYPPIYITTPTPKQKAKPKVVYPPYQPKQYIPLPASPIIDYPPTYTQSPYAEGGKMPQWLAEVRFKAAGKEDELGDYGYLDEAGDGKWIQKATASIKRRGTEGVCTGSKFGGPGCPPGSKRYNLAKTFRKMAKSRKKEDGGYAQGKEYEMTDAQIAKLRAMGYKIKEV